MKQQILYIQSSIFGDNGVSSGIARKLIDKLSTTNASEVVERNVSASEIPHFNFETITAIGEGKAALADELIAEVQQADIIIVGAPMYNFGIPTQLKSWFDHIARAGVTFKYSETGPVGLLGDKKVYVVTARGGLHKGNGTDLDSSYLQTMFGFLGITDVEFIYAEGVNLGDDARSKSIAAAEQQVIALA
ncbi:FMN-dependent NADH-azoreductase [Neptunicella sp. SCSIO 80796]|uniref:FMN-dependent NADH-azoreductase n=1 Tax=Neptunicella plasticusilytica TaxID=3117012 RepID=UPI003A4E02FC